MDDLLAPDDRQFFATQPIEGPDGHKFNRVTFQLRNVELRPPEFIGEVAGSLEVEAQAIKWAAAMVATHCLMLGQGKLANDVLRAASQWWPSDVDEDSN